jgi:ABC-2 type transport system ATP-binding protein
MGEPVVSVSGLRKTYGHEVAVDGIDLAVGAGEVFGLLGPNGAGKTTTFECLEGLRRRDAGTVGICGIDPDRAGRRLAQVIGVQLQSSALPATMTPREALTFFSAYHRRSPDFTLLERMGLTAHASTRYDELSGGLQRRLSLALAVAHEPRVVFLDEPTSGLDVGSRVELHQMVEDLSAAGTTILLATHDMAEAERLADRVAILLHGEIVALGTPRELTATGAGYTKVLVRTEPTTLLDGVEVPAARRVQTDDGYATFFTSDARTSVGAILAALQDDGSALVDLRVERPSLEERFLELTGATT